MCAAFQQLIYASLLFFYNVLIIFVCSYPYHTNFEGPCVVMAAPGMLQSGLSRRLFERWCDDERNGLVLADILVQGTAHDLLSEPKALSAWMAGELPENAL